MTPLERKLNSTVSANMRWAQEPDRCAATKPAREAFQRKFEQQVDPDGTMAPDERAKRAKNARTAYFSALALKSSRSRRRSKELAEEASAAEAELAAMGGEAA